MPATPKWNWLQGPPFQVPNSEYCKIFGLCKKNNRKTGERKPCPHCISHGYYCRTHLDQDPLRRKSKLEELGRAANAYVANNQFHRHQHHYYHYTTNNDQLFQGPVQF